MKQFIKSQSYLMKNDDTCHAILFLNAIASLALLVYVGNKLSFSVEYVLEPIEIIAPLLLMLYVLVPIYVVFYSTEDFETRSILNIIASGQNRAQYIIGKAFAITKLVIWNVFQFIVLYTLPYCFISVFKGNYALSFVMEGSGVVALLKIILFHTLFLTGCCFFVLMCGILIRSSAITAIATFVCIGGDFMICGYMSESSNVFFQFWANQTITRQICEFSNIGVVTVQNMPAPTPVAMLVKGLCLVIVCLAIAIATFCARDIA